MIRDLTEMDKLEAYLKENHIDYKRIDEEGFLPPVTPLMYAKGMVEPFDRHQIIVYENGRRSWDVICQRGSYGVEKGLLEGLGNIFKIDEPVEGNLTAAEIIQRIETQTGRR